MPLHNEPFDVQNHLAFKYLLQCTQFKKTTEVMTHYSFSKLLTHNLAHKLGQISNLMNSSDSWLLKNTHSFSNPLMNNPAHKLSQISSLLGKRQ